MLMLSTSIFATARLHMKAPWNPECFVLESWLKVSNMINEWISTNLKWTKIEFCFPIHRWTWCLPGNTYYFINIFGDSFFSRFKLKCILNFYESKIRPISIKLQIDRWIISFKLMKFFPFCRMRWFLGRFGRTFNMWKNGTIIWHHFVWWI